MKEMHWHDLVNHHPCFNVKCIRRSGRIHLPIAPSCNLQCAYCRRDFACVNESRPGVSNGVLTPEKAVAHLDRSLAELPHISVVGIAGPGDAFAEPELTLKTFELIRQRHPELMLCLSSNGLNIQAYINDLEALAARFVTLTVNTIDPVIGQKIYEYVTWNGKRITGEKAAQLLIENQLAAIRLLKAKGFVVKINSVVIPGINDCHVPFLAKVLGGMKIDFLNLLPLIPVSGTKMETIRPPTAKAIKALKEQTSRYVTHMNHCVKCRSDAAGLLVV